MQQVTAHERVPAEGEPETRKDQAKIACEMRYSCLQNDLQPKRLMVIFLC